LKRLTAVLAIILFAPAAYAGLSNIGIGIHGGIISGYDNPILEDTLIQQYTDIDFSGDMTNLGMHIIIGTLRIIEFDGSLDYAWKKHEIIQGINLTFSDISVSGSVIKSFPVAILKPYAGAGVGVHALAYSLETGGQTAALLPDNETKLGYHLKVGIALDLPVFPITPSAEWKYNIIQTSDKSTKYNSINVGITLDLP
jgi:opacity protein-like surface antigen